MPITAIAIFGFSDMACSLSFDTPSQLWVLAGHEHGRTLPLSGIAIF
jgi:hypothetical protein